MHMVSRKGLNSAESDTVRTSKSPTTAVKANGEVLTKEEATAYVRELCLFVTVMLLEGAPAVLSLAKLCEDHRYNYHWTSGQKPKLFKHGRKIECNTANYEPFVVPGVSTSSSSSSSPTSLTSSSQEAVTPTPHPSSRRSERMSHEERETRRVDQQILKNQIKKDNEEVRGDPLRDLPEWLEEFTDNLVDESVPEHRDAPARRAKVVSGKHGIFTHFPKDRNCEVCLRTKITRTLCRRRTGGAVPRAEIFGDLITTDHKVLSE